MRSNLLRKKQYGRAGAVTLKVIVMLSNYFVLNKLIENDIFRSFEGIRRCLSGTHVVLASCVL